MCIDFLIIFNPEYSKSLDSLSHGASIVVHKPPFGFETRKIKSLKIRGSKKNPASCEHFFATKVHSITKHAKLHTQTISVLLSNIGDFIPNNLLERKFSSFDPLEVFSFDKP